MNRLASAALVVGGMLAGMAKVATAATVLSGNVTYDGVTGLYTYSYALDNTNGPAPIYSLNILVDSVNHPPQNSGPAISLASNYTSPSGWNFSSSTSGSIAQPPVNEFGSFWYWGTNFANPCTDCLPVGQTLAGFSFAVALAPTISTANNYFLYSRDYTGGPSNIGGGGVVEYGHIVAPDFGTAVVPIPAALPLLLSALGFFGFMGWRRKKAAT